MSSLGRLALIALGTCVLFLSACSNGGGSSTPEPISIQPPAHPCTDPRPEICTQEYIGVCATFADGSSRTMATGCTACANGQVIGWGPGECD